MITRQGIESTIMPKDRSDLPTAGNGGFRRLLRFHQNPAEFQETMQRRKPQLPTPRQARFLARQSQLTAIVRAAFPCAADNHSLQCIFRRQQQQPTAGLQHTRQLPQSGARVRKMLDHPSTSDAVERTVRKWQLGQIACDIAWASVLETPSRAAQHPVREIESNHLCFGMGLLEQVSQDLSRSRTDVENAPARRHIELPATKNIPDQRLVKRHDAPEHQHRPGRAVVQVPDVTPVLLHTQPVDSAKFHQAPQGCPCGATLFPERSVLASHAFGDGDKG